MKLSEIDTTLREIRVSPVRSLGQNFLHDRNLAAWIVAKADLSPDDYVIEIGPGLGALTEFILESGARVLAIEKDQRLAQFLAKRFAGARLEIIHGDALDFDLRPLFAERRVKLLGNLPYYVASQLLLKFIKYPSPISLWLFMLQKEMARRISAQPGTSDYGALTLNVQLKYRVEFLRSVPATVFLPEPEVDSAIVRLVPRAPKELPAHDAETFSRLVRRGFSQRRKQLRNLLKTEVTEWSDAATAIGFDPRTRAEELSLEQWIALSNRAPSGGAHSATQEGAERFAVVDGDDRVTGDAPRGEVHGNNLRHRAVHLFIFNGQGELFLQKRSPWKDRHPLLWDSSAAGHVEAGEDYDETAARELKEEQGKNLRQRADHHFKFNGQGELFLQKRSPWKDRHPLLWDSSAAGHVEAGEDYDETAARELKEELGVEAELTRVLKLPASERTGQEFIWLYRGEHNGPFRLASAEIEHGEFFPLDIVAGWIKARPNEFAPGFLECWKAYQGSL